MHHRRTIRLPGYDYAQPGGYFVTMVTQDRALLFGEIIDGEMRLNEFGAIADETWRWLAGQFPYVDLDTWAIMPNHVHGILMIKSIACRGGSIPGGDGLQPGGDGLQPRRGGSRPAPTCPRPVDSLHRLFAESLIR